MEGDITTLLVGQLGGAIAAGFGAGWAASYAFVKQTIIKDLRDRVVKLEEKEKEHDALLNKIAKGRLSELET